LGLAENSTKSWDKIKREMVMYEDIINEIVTKNGLVSWRVDHIHNGVHFNMVWKGVSPLLHYFVTHSYF